MNLQPFLDLKCLPAVEELYRAHACMREVCSTFEGYAEPVKETRYKALTTCHKPHLAFISMAASAHELPSKEEADSLLLARPGLTQVLVKHF